MIRRGGSKLRATHACTWVFEKMASHTVETVSAVHATSEDVCEEKVCEATEPGYDAGVGVGEDDTVNIKTSGTEHK